MRRCNTAFTLLEVMAAVAVVAIVFTTLARVASQGLQSEGTSHRRLEASLLADSVLADIEDQIAAGTTPEIGSSEEGEEEDTFAIFVDVTAFDLLSAIPMPDSGDGAFASAEPGFSLGGGGIGGSAETPLRQIQISVVWNEGLHEQSVTRTTFGIDQAAIQSVLGAAVESLGPAAPAPAGGAQR
jgi:prepilin-type N-terminal cleavage/methylation domain-containing protein